MIHVAYYTDPVCPWSWGAEPQLRRLEVEFAGQVDFTYVMAGMAREVDAPKLLESTLAMVEATGMPADPRIWLERPPRSSFPACLAVKAAAEQGLDAAFLRRARLGVTCRRERSDNAEALLAAARDVAELDLLRFEIDLASNAIVEAFGADRERAQAACAGADRPELPALSVADGPPLTDPASWRDALLAAGGTPGPLLSEPAALERFGPLGSAELAAVCGIPATRARIDLWRAAAEWRARPEPLVCGELWEPAR